MQKNSITNKITPCCGLPFSVMYWWIMNLTLNSENDREFILSKISQGGTISIEAWKVLINSGTLEADASLTKAEFLAWFDCGKQPKCEQLKLIVEGFKVSNWDAFSKNFEELNERISLKFNDDTFSKANNVIELVDKKTFEILSYKKTNVWLDNSAMNDSFIDDVVYIKKGNDYYVLTDFLNGIISKNLDLRGKILNFGKKIEFRGGILSNGTIDGENTTIIADAVKIFELNLTLSGKFNASKVCVEWFGSIPNDYSSVDLKDSIDKLNAVFFDINLNEGVYFTNKCNIQINGISGKGVNNTIVDFRCKSNDRGFILGVDNGGINDRTYRNYIKNLKCSFDSSSKAEGVYGILVGATHKPLVENVQVSMNAQNLILNNSELLDINSNISTKWNKLNAGLCFNGAGEVADVSNFMTLSTVGIMFRQNYDFIQFIDYMSWNGENGFSTVFVVNDTGSNIVFSGSQSWSQGLYGFYAMPCNTIAGSFVNYKIENVRIEQLSHVKQNDKLVGCNFHIGEQYYLHSLLLNNIMFSGETNGINLTNIRVGNVVLENIGTFDNPAIPKDYSVKVEMQAGMGSYVSLINVRLAGEIMGDVKKVSDLNEIKLFPNEIVYSKSDDKRLLMNKQVIEIQSGNTNYLNIENTNVSHWKAGQIKRIKVVVVSASTADFVEFVFYADKTYKILSQMVGSNIVFSQSIQDEKFTLIIDGSGIIFMFNKIGQKVLTIIDSEDIFL